MGQRGYTPDIEMLFKDAGAIVASAAGQVGGSDKIIDVGAARFEAVMIVDVSALDIASNDEIYDIIVQGSTSASFASGIENLAQLNLAATEVRDGGAQDSTTGRYELPFCNEQDGTIYRYLRLYTKVAGSTPSINHTAWAGEKY